MATSRSLLLSVFLSGLVFSAAALPLVVLGSRSITVEVEEKPLLTGRLQDLASPYLGAVLGLSAGVGIVALSISEWRNTARKLNQTRDRVSLLEQQLQQQESQVERLKFSESRLQSQGLNFFLEPANTLPAAPVSPIPPSHPATLQHAMPHSSSHPASPQIEELVVAMKQLMNQVEQLKADTSHGATHSINSSINASARA